ncbi:UDP-glucose dehydrogenase family protein [Nitrospira sp. Kam-Ns4a]
MRISVIGLGKLGACAAACFAYRGVQTIGVDINPRVVDAINTGRAPVQEPRLQELITASHARLRATQDYAEAVRASDVSFLIVPTPSQEDGHFSDERLREALRHLARAFGEQRKPYHLFVVTSTVSPGTTEGQLIPLIESVSGRRVNRDFGVCYNPEFIALGNVINDSLNPDLVLIGESDRRAGDIVEEIYRRTCENRPYMARMSIISAEITKISLNSYVTMKISFANTLASLCERIPGADVDAITAALGADKRVSPHYLKGGLSFGGPCFPRDNRAFAAFAEKYGGQAILAKATDTVNDLQMDGLVRRVLKFLKEGDTVGVLGLAYKPNTPVIEESPALRLIQELLKKDIKVIVYDPMAMEEGRAVLRERVAYGSTARDCVAKANVCVIVTPWEEFKKVDEGWIEQNTLTVIDCWRVLDPSRFSERVRYVAMGSYC